MTPPTESPEDIFPENPCLTLLEAQQEQEEKETRAAIALMLQKILLDYSWLSQMFGSNARVIYCTDVFLEELCSECKALQKRLVTVLNIHPSYVKGSGSIKIPLILDALDWLLESNLIEGATFKGQPFFILHYEEAVINKLLEKEQVD